MRSWDREHIIGKDKLLYRAIKGRQDQLHYFSWTARHRQDDAGEGHCQYHQCGISADQCHGSGQKGHGRSGGKGRRNCRECIGKRTILFIDEIHRFNKGQQDYLLRMWRTVRSSSLVQPQRNPYFEVNGALISRSVIFELKPIPRGSHQRTFEKAVYDTDRGMGAYNGTIDEGCPRFSGRYLRQAMPDMPLNAIELGIMTTRTEDG